MCKQQQTALKFQSVCMSTDKAHSDVDCRGWGDGECVCVEGGLLWNTC